jgi:ribosomal protein L40E
MRVSMPDGEGAPAPLEEKLNTISSKLAELEDLQLVNKLDIVNLKNEIEKLKLTVSAPSLNTLEKIKELGSIVENAEEFKKLKTMAKNIDKVMTNLEVAKPEDLEGMIKVVDDIDRRVGKLEARGPGMKPGEAGKYAKSLEELRSGLESLPKGARRVLDLSKQLEKLRLIVEENTRNIWRLRKAEKRAVRKPEKKALALKCPKCNTLLPPNAKFCRRCGARVV